MPFSWLSQYLPVKAGSVPFCRATWYCSGVSCLRHSSSFLVIFSVAVFSGIEVLTLLLSFRMRIPYAASLLLLLAGIAGAQGTLKRYKSETFGYAIQYPASWYRNPTRLTDTFDIQNFPPSKAVHGLYIPPRGAEIAVAPWESGERREGPRPTLDEWANADTVHQNVIAKRTFEIRMPYGNEPAIEVKIETDEAPGPLSEAVKWYFHVKGRLFSALLIYWQGDPNADKYVRAMRQIVLSLDVIPDSRGQLDRNRGRASRRLSYPLPSVFNISLCGATRPCNGAILDFEPGQKL